MALPFARVSTLLRSPFVGGAEREMSTRAKLDAELREVLGHTPLEVTGGILLGLIVSTVSWLILK